MLNRLILQIKFQFIRTKNILPKRNNTQYITFLFPHNKNIFRFFIQRLYRNISIAFIIRSLYHS